MPGTVFISGDNVDLVTIEEEDIEWMRDNINDPNLRKTITARYPVNMKQEKEFFENVVSEREEGVHLIIAKENKRIGMISLFDINRDEGRAEIGIWITSSKQGKGHGTEACEIITEYGFRELRLHRIYARVLENNPASLKVFEKLGFVKEGNLRDHAFIDGDYQNMHVFGILREEWRRSN